MEKQCLVMLAIHGSLPRLVTLCSLVGMAILAILAFPGNLVSLSLQVVIATRPSLVSRICLGLGLGTARP